MVSDKIKFNPPRLAGVFLLVKNSKAQKVEERFLKLPKGEQLLPPEQIGRFIEIRDPDRVLLVVDIGQPRISSTARAILLGSGSGFDEIHFQPFKFIQRHARDLEKLTKSPKVEINKNGNAQLILLKETPGGPNDPKENFDPVAILLEKGVRAEQIRAIVGIREPFAQFESWLKFDPSRQTEIFKQGQYYILRLLENYRNLGINVVPSVFELCYPDPDIYLSWLYYNALSLEGLIRLPQGLNFSSNPNVIWHEANPQLDELCLTVDVGSAYYKKVVQPILEKGKFITPQPRIPYPEQLPELFPHISRLNPRDIQVLKSAAQVYLEKASAFYQQAREQGLPQNKFFEQFIKNYRLNLMRL